MLRTLLLASHASVPNLSYYWDWHEALTRHPRLRVDVVSTLGKGRLTLELLRRRRREYDLVLFPYGYYYANDDRWSRTLAGLLAEMSGVKVFFLENEYRLLDRKLALARRAGADFVTTQLPLDVARKAYAGHFLLDRIVALPHGLSDRLAHELGAPVPDAERPIDLGFSGDAYPFYLGHQDRAEMGRFFRDRAAGWGLRIEYREGRESRLAPKEWIAFLLRCKGALHQEAGSDYLEVNDVTRQAVNELLVQRPDTPFAEVRARFFDAYPSPLSGRAIAPRHLEAIATRTCQIMFRGRFNDILEPDLHYLCLEKDFSNAEDVVARFKDPASRRAVAERAYEHVRAGHLLSHRIDGLLRDVGLG